MFATFCTAPNQIIQTWTLSVLNHVVRHLGDTWTALKFTGRILPSLMWSCKMCHLVELSMNLELFTKSSLWGKIRDIKLEKDL